jgi:hypothetical protein
MVVEYIFLALGSLLVVSGLLDMAGITHVTATLVLFILNLLFAIGYVVKSMFF